MLLSERPVENYTESAIRKAREMDSADILSELDASGLRGRGGAGFPAGRKWRSIADHPCPKRFVVCNAAEGEPGTFKDRFLIRKNPYPLLEGMLIAAHTVGTREMFIAIKASFTKEIARLEHAIDQIGTAGMLDGYEITIVPGPEEYLFGEEKALLNVIEGSGPLPRENHRPPYEFGLFAEPASPNPALVNNVETYARVPGIILNGAAKFREHGTDDTPGTLLFTVCGDVKRPGVYEMEAGTPLREVFEKAGGPLDGRAFRGALSGVASAVIKEEHFDTPAEFGALSGIGSGLGSAGFIVFDDRANIPRITQAVARFLYVESCNQCSACKQGLRTASHRLDDIFAQGRTDIASIDRGAHSAPQANRCYLPVQGSKLIPSLLEAFPEDFVDPKPGDPYPIPKIVDYDEDRHEFTYDGKQKFKLPNWKYADERGETARYRRGPDQYIAEMLKRRG